MTSTLADKYSSLISHRVALQTLGSVSELVSAAFSSEPGLARSHPEAAQMVSELGLFRSNGVAASDGARDRAEEWIEEHSNSLESVIPGIKYRHTVTKELSKILEEISEIIDPQKLLTETASVNSDKLVELEETLQQLEGNEEASTRAIVQFMDKALPGLGKWFVLEQSVTTSLVQ